MDLLPRQDYFWARQLQLVVIVLVAIAAFAQAGFVINTTAGFDAGIKSNSSGNWQIETYTDNFNITNNTFALGNAYSDRFTFPDADANTWKWLSATTGATITDEKDIDTTEAGELHFRVEYDTAQGPGGYTDTLVFSNTMISGDFDIETDFSDYSAEGYDNYMFFGLYSPNTPGGFMSNVIGRSTENPGMEEYYTTYDWLLWEQVESTNTSGRLRITRETTGPTEQTWSYYYWNNTGGAWVLNGQSVYDTTGTYPEADDDFYIGYWIEATDNADEAITNFDGFKVNSGTLVADSSDVYRTSGNWTSAVQTMTGTYLGNTTINYSGVSVNNYITQIEWLVGGVVKATYATDITSGTSIIITEANLTSGTFSNVSSNFTIRVYLTGNGTGSPIIESISGNYYSQVPYSTNAIITDNSIKMLWLLNENATLNDLTTNIGHTVLYNQSEWYTYLLPTTASSWYGQSINETADYNMSGVVLSLSESSARFIRYSNFTFTVRIETDNANKPSGTLAHVNATTTLNATQIYSNIYSAQYYQAATAFIFNSSINLTKNTTYWIVLKPSGGSGYEYFATGYGRTDRYPRGNLSTTTNAGTLWTMGINDLWFYVLTPTKNSSAISYNATNNTATLAAGWFIEVDGAGELVMDAGETLTGETVAAGKYLQVGALGGGLLTMNGNSTNYTNIFSPNNATTRKDYLVMVYYMGRMKADYANITGYASGASLYVNAVYGSFQIRNSYIKNLYANSAGYPVMLTTGRFSTMNNCTIIKSHASYPIYMVAYAGQGIVLINNNITTSSAYSLAVYNTATVTYAGVMLVDNTFNGAPLVIGNVTHVYSTSNTFFGHVISPRIIANGTPVALASVTIMKQFDLNDLPNQLYGYGYTDRTVADYLIAATGIEPLRPMAVTNANGYPKDELGLNTLWAVDKAYIGTAKTLYTYYGGSNTSIRPLGYTWKNDGTDYGYIITATDGNNSKSVVVNPNATYTADMNLTNPTTPVSNPIYQQVIEQSSCGPGATGSSSSGSYFLLFCLAVAVLLGIGLTLNKSKGSRQLPQ